VTINNFYDQDNGQKQWCKTVSYGTQGRQTIVGLDWVNPYQHQSVWIPLS
jgi:hypothetical protein